MKSQRILCRLFLASALVPGLAYAAPKDPITLGCGYAVIATGLNGGSSTNLKLTGDATWNVKTLGKSGATVLQVRREPGATSDLLWCDYREASNENSAVWMQMSAVMQAPVDHPKCTVGADQKSFTCRVLGSGETY